MRSGGPAACPVDADFDPLSPAFLADPFAVLNSLARETPVFYAPSIDYYVVTRYVDIETVFLDHDTYSAAPRSARSCSSCRIRAARVKSCSKRMGAS
jgi:hypothetical protein